MSEVLFSSLQFKFAQCHTWVTMSHLGDEKIAKHKKKKNAKHILHSILV